MSWGDGERVPAPTSQAQPQVDDFDYQVQIAMAISKQEAEARLPKTNRPPEFAADSLPARTLTNGDAKGASRARASEGREKPGQVLACRYWLSMCLDYGEVPCNGFYDLWGEFPEAKGHEGRVPSLNQLMTLVSENDYGDPREVLLVDYTSDTRLCQLRTVALAACAQCDSVESKVGLLAKLIEEHLGGSAKTNSSYRMAFEQEAMQIKRKNKSYVILIGQLTHGIARHRALLFKVLASELSLQCRLVRGKFYCGGDEEAMVVVKLPDHTQFIVDLINEPGKLVLPESVDALRDESASFRQKAHGNQDAQSAEAHKVETLLDHLQLDPEFENGVADLVQQHGVSIEDACDALIHAKGYLANAHKVCQGADMFGTSMLDTAHFMDMCNWDLERATHFLLRDTERFSRKEPSHVPKVKRQHTATQRMDEKQQQRRQQEVEQIERSRKERADQAPTSSKANTTGEGANQKRNPTSKAGDRQRQYNDLDAGQQACAKSPRSEASHRKPPARAPPTQETSADPQVKAPTTSVGLTTHSRVAARLKEMKQFENKTKDEEDEAQQVRQAFLEKYGDVVVSMDLPDVLRMFDIVVGHDNSSVDVRKAYREALRRYHPDKLSRQTVHARVFGTEVFKLINQKMDEYSHSM